MAGEEPNTGKDITREGRTERMPRPTGPLDEFDHFFENFFTRNWMQPFGLGRLQTGPGVWPRADVIDRETEIFVRAEVPGIEKDAIEISVAEDRVTIRGSVKYGTEEERGEYYRSETMRGDFSRTFNLPAQVDTEKANASFSNGVLELHLPKLEQSRRRTIPVS